MFRDAVMVPAQGRLSVKLDDGLFHTMTPQIIKFHKSSPTVYFELPERQRQIGLNHTILSSSGQRKTFYDTKGNEISSDSRSASAVFFIRDFSCNADHLLVYSNYDEKFQRLDKLKPFLESGHLLTLHVKNVPPEFEEVFEGHWFILNTKIGQFITVHASGLILHPQTLEMQPPPANQYRIFRENRNTKVLRRNIITGKPDEYDLTTDVDWYTDTRWEKMYSISNDGEESSIYDSEFLLKKLSQGGRVSITFTDGDALHASQAAIVVCIEVCSATLHRKHPLSVTSTTTNFDIQHDFIYESVEIMDNKAFITQFNSSGLRTRKIDSEIQWYMDMFPYEIVFRMNRGGYVALGGF